MASHPVWVRGLKHRWRYNEMILETSHPVWVRGLKLKQNAECKTNGEVAPRVGAWIETVEKNVNLNLSQSHPVWVRGLKQKLLND